MILRKWQVCVWWPLVLAAGTLLFWDWGMSSYSRLTPTLFLVRIIYWRINYTYIYIVALDIREEGEDRLVTVLNPWDGNYGSFSNELHEQVEKLTIQKQRGRVYLMDNEWRLYSHWVPDLFEVSWQDLCLAFDGLYLSWNPEIFRRNIEFHGYDLLHPNLLPSV